MLKIKKVKPMFTSILCTADKFTEPQYMPGSSIIDASKTKQGLKEYQTVLAIGTSVRDIQVGDVVLINPAAYAVKKFDKNSMKSTMNDVYNEITTYNFNILLVNDVECLLITDRDVELIVEESEEVSELKEPSVGIIKQ